MTTPATRVKVSGFAGKERVPLGRSVALDTSLGYIWEDYTQRPHEWKHSARSYMAAILRHNKIVNNVTINMLLDRTLDMLADNEWLGNRRMAMRCFGTVCRNYEREKREAKMQRTPLVERRLYDQARQHPDKFNPDGTERGFYETGFVPNIAAATATMVAYEASQRQTAATDKENLDDWFGKKEDRNVTDLNDELTVWSAVNAEPEGQQFAAFNHFQRELKLLDETADVTKTALAALDGVPLGLHIQQHGIKVTCDKLQKALDEYGQSKSAPKQADLKPSAIPIAQPSSDATEAAPASVEKSKSQEASQMTESPVVVYPKSDGSIVYKGVKFSVTFRDGGKWDAAFPLMEEFLVHRELIARNCLEDVAQAMPSNITQMTPPVAPAPPASVAQSAGSGAYAVVEIKKIVDEGKTRIELFSHPGDDKAAGAVRRPRDIALLVAAGVNVDALAIGTRYTVNLEATWKDGNLNPKNNLPYRDITAIRKVG